MRKILLLALAGLFCTPAHADFTAKDASAATITFKGTGVCTSVVCVPLFTLFDPTGTNGAAVDTAGADGVSNTKNGLATYSRLVIYNGTTWDRWQGGISIASGKVASGAFAAGSLAAGAGVDGWDLTQGAIADAAVTAGATGSVSAKLRSISRDIGTVATNTTGAATAANQATEIASLATIATNTGAAIPAGTASIGNVGQLPYPIGATPFTASATGTTTGAVATLTGAASVTAYICGFSVRANATAAATVNIVVSGTISGSLNFTEWVAPLASGIGIAEMVFSPCIPASAQNTSIVVTGGAPGSGGVNSTSAWGYKL